MKDLDTVFVIVALLLGLIGGIALGIAAEKNAWVSDCDTLGVHRHEQKAYECRAKP